MDNLPFRRIKGRKKYEMLKGSENYFQRNPKREILIFIQPSELKHLSN
jgi:hypothetical protein